MAELVIVEDIEQGTLIGSRGFLALTEILDTMGLLERVDVLLYTTLVLRRQ
jgi:hypothetical protein